MTPASKGAVRMVSSPYWAKVDAPLGVYVDGFRKELRRLGYTPLTAAAHVRLMAHLSRWLVRQGLPASALNVRLARPFLADRVGADGQLDLAGLQAGEVAAFVLAQSRQRPRSAKRIVTAVRSLLRFAHVTGLIDQPLAAGVSSPAGWTLTSLPKGLDPTQVTALLAGCDRSTATGCRDFAILTLLVRLGLRVGEVATLAL